MVQGNQATVCGVWLTRVVCRFLEGTMAEIRDGQKIEKFCKFILKKNREIYLGEI